MTVLVIGGGGREHAICHFLKKSPRITRLICAPGNGGISDIADCFNIRATDVEGMLTLSKSESVDFAVIASDDPLAAGMSDAFTAAGIRHFGPKKDAAIIESSKVFSKSLMKKYGIPTAEYESFSEMENAIAYLEKKSAPIVVKADGLALGKGVTVAATRNAAISAVREIMGDMKFGESGARVVIEDYMRGREATVLCFTDGKTIVPMPVSRDHKRAFDDDVGPNTGGMGAICPIPDYTPELAGRCMNEIFIPTVEAMNKEGRTFKGVLYFELMLTEYGPKVIEYNARFGDPEAQVVLSLLDTELLDIFEAVSDECLGDIKIKWKDGAACCVVLASGGYPDSYATGFGITGLPNIPDDVTVFHAGTKKDASKYLTSGGRVLGVTAVAASLDAAIQKAYSAVDGIQFKDMHYRKDIGKTR